MSIDTVIVELPNSLAASEINSRVLDGRAVDDGLLESQVQTGGDVVERANPSTARHGDEGFARDLGKELRVCPRARACRIDVDQHQLVDAFVVEDPYHVDRITEISGLGELRRLDQTVSLEQQHRDDPRPEPHVWHATREKFLSNAMPNR